MQEVVDALGNEARLELAKIMKALRRMDSGEFGTCAECAGDRPQGGLLQGSCSLVAGRRILISA